MALTVEQMDARVEQLLEQPNAAAEITQLLLENGATFENARSYAERQVQLFEEASSAAETGVRTATAVADPPADPEPASEDISDDEIIARAVELLESGTKRAEIKTTLLAEFDGIDSDVDGFIDSAYEREAEKIRDHEAEMIEHTMDVNDRAEKAEFEVKKLTVENAAIKTGQKIPLDDPAKIEAYKQQLDEFYRSRLPKFKAAKYPTFPDYVMHGTSLYEGFVKPICDKNSRIPSFLFMPALIALLNFVGNKVVIAFKNTSPSIFAVLIGQAGLAIKSSSVNDSLKFFNYAGVLDFANRDMQNADGKSIVFTVGSTEGLGVGMQRMNCKNAILFYDEFKTLADKAGIESSSMNGHLLTLYEGGSFSNSVKNKKEAFEIPAGTYVASLIACNTVENFNENWGRFAKQSAGMDSRFFFLLEPETLPAARVYNEVNTLQGAIQMKIQIDQAIQQRTFEFEDSSLLDECLKRYGNRAEIRAEKFALGFAIILGRKTIDKDCIARGVALVAYESEVKDYLKVHESETKQAAWQQQIVSILRKQPGCVMPKKGKNSLMYAMKAQRFDTTIWNQFYRGLINAGIIREEGRGTIDSPVMVRLLETMDGSEGGE